MPHQHVFHLVGQFGRKGQGLDLVPHGGIPQHERWAGHEKIGIAQYLQCSQQVGSFKADILVEDTVIVELKSIRSLSLAHEVQLVNYLVATGKPVGLLINFSEKQVEVRRKVRQLKTGQQSPTNPVDPVILSTPLTSDHTHPGS